MVSNKQEPMFPCPKPKNIRSYLGFWPSDLIQSLAVISWAVYVLNLISVKYTVFLVDTKGTNIYITFRKLLINLRREQQFMGTPVFRQPGQTIH